MGSSRDPHLCQLKQTHKPCTKLKVVINRGKRSNTPSEVKAVKIINENLESFFEISSVQKDVLSHKLEDHAYEYQNPFGLKEDNLSQRNFQNQLSHPGLFHIEQECQESLIQGKIHNQQNSNEGNNKTRFDFNQPNRKRSGEKLVDVKHLPQKAFLL